MPHFECRNFYCYFLLREERILRECCIYRFLSIFKTCSFLPVGMSGSLIKHYLPVLYIGTLDTHYYDALNLIGDTEEIGSK
jgi:hypothetical protein